MLSESVGKKRANKFWWNDEVKAPVEKKKAVWKKVLRAMDEIGKERCMEANKEEKIKVKRCVHQSTKEVSEQFGRKMNQDVS